jgi:hypothetical protein
MWDMLERALAKLTDEQRRALTRGLLAFPATEMPSAVLVLHEFMKATYWETMVL